MRGGAWLGGGSVAEQASRFARNMILTRLLAPSAFGAMAIVMSSSAIVGALTEVGVKQAVIQNPRGGEKAYLNAGWWMGLGRALSTYVIIFAMAPWVARFYGIAELVCVASSDAAGLSVRWRHESPFHSRAERDEVRALDGHQQRRRHLWSHPDGGSQFCSS